MKILLITLGSQGDINPFIRLGLNFKKLNCEVTVVTSEVYADTISSCGLRFLACGTASEYQNHINNPDLYNEKKNLKLIYQYIILRSMRKIYAIIAEFDPKDTLIIATPFMLGARLAQEKLGFSLITVCLQPVLFWSIIQPPKLPGLSLEKTPYFLKKLIFAMLDRWVIDKILSPQVNQFRKELGLKKIHSICSKWMFSPQKVIGLFPDWFASKAPDWPPQTELTNFLDYDVNANQPLAREIVHFLQSGKPPLVLTYGTCSTQCESFFSLCLEAARKLDQRVIILTPFPNQLPLLNSNNEMHADYVPFNQLFPHVSLVIHHGGIGTLSKALSMAIPQLIVPFTGDQFDNADRIEQLGAGLALVTKNYSVENVIDKMQELLNSARIKNNCLCYAEKISAIDTNQLISQLIEKYLNKLEG